MLEFVAANVFGVFQIKFVLLQILVFLFFFSFAYTDTHLDEEI